MTACSLLLTVVLCAAEPDGPITVDARRQLFLDDYLLASMSHVRRVIEPARKHPANPLIWPSEEWEQKVAIVYGSIIHDGGKYRMWYKSGIGVAYAESDDGIRWVKPELDFVVVDGRKTNILFRADPTGKVEQFPYFYEPFGVHKDEREPDPARRYKLGFLSLDRNYQGPNEGRYHKGQRRGLGVAGSPDGLRWTLLESWTTEAICDGPAHWMYDPRLEKYVLYGRAIQTPPEIQAAWSKYDWYRKWHVGRAVARVESADFLNWNLTRPASAPVVLTPDTQDPPGTEIYSMMVFPYESVYMGLVQVFLARPDASWLDVQLAVSRDGVRFTRVGDRAAFIALGDVGEWDRFNLSLANNPPLQVGDELRFYYGGRLYRHGPYAGPDRGVSRGGIGLATIPRDRFAALVGSFDGGEVVTRPLKLTGRRLHLNAKADFGNVTLEVLDADGQTIAVSKPIERDSLDIPVEWQEGALPGGDVPIRLRIKLQNARLYALWCE